MRDLERELRAMRVEWPATPDLVAGLRLEPRQVSFRPVRSRARLAAIALAVLTGGIAAVEPARSAVLELLGLKSVRIERREPTAPPRPAGAALNLGRSVTQAQAQRLATPMRPRQPAALGRPDGVFFSTSPLDVPQVSYTYRPRDGIPESAETGLGVLVTEFPPAVTPFLEKTVGMGVRVDRFTIDGHPASFISGKPHGVGYLTPNGNAHFDEQRLAGTTLLVESRDLLIRIEGELSRTRATTIARSIPPS